MKTICQYTGLPIAVPHFSTFQPTVKFYHPIFTLPLRNLFAIWEAGIPPTAKAESLLLCAAFLRASGHVEFTCAINWQTNPESVHKKILQNLEPLALTVAAIAGDASEEIPTIILTPETADLSNLDQWLRIWTEALELKSATAEAKAQIAARRRLESRLDYFIRHQKTTGAYSGCLCNWLKEAASLPAFQIQSPLTKQWISLSDYWCDILCRAIKGEIYSLPLNDVKEFYNHLIDNLDDVGSNYAHAALSALQKIIFAQTQGLGISTSYSFVGGSNPVSEAAQNLVTAIADKLTEEPQRNQFVTASEYLRAKTAWNAKKFESMNFSVPKAVHALGPLETPDSEILQTKETEK